MRSFLYSCFAFLIWSTWVIPVRLLGYNTYTISFYLCLFATILWGFFHLLSRKSLCLKKSELLGLFVLSCLFVSNLITYLLSLNLTHSSIAVITHYTAPIFVAVLAPIVLKEKITKVTVFSLMAAFAGFLIIFYNKGLKFSFDKGAFYGLASGLFYGLSVIVAKKLLRTVESEKLIFYQNLFSSFILLLFFQYIDFDVSLSLFGKMFLLALIYSGIASFLYLYGLYHLGGVRTSIVGYFEPLGTIFWGWLIFNEMLTVRIIIGGFLVLLSGYIVTRYDKIEK